MSHYAGSSVMLDDVSVDAAVRAIARQLQGKGAAASLVVLAATGPPRILRTAKLFHVAARSKELFSKFWTPAHGSTTRHVGVRAKPDMVLQ